MAVLPDLAITALGGVARETRARCTNLGGRHWAGGIARGVDVVGVVQTRQVELETELAGEGHLGRGHREPALGQVVAGGHGARGDRAVQRGEEHGRTLEVGARHAAGLALEQAQVMAGAELLVGATDEVDAVPGLL